MGKKKCVKRIMAAVLSLAMTFTYMPVSAYAQEIEPRVSDDEKQMIANFTFDDTDNPLAGGEAKATANGGVSYVDYNGGKALRLENSGWIDVKKNDDSALLAGLTEFTLSYDSKAEGAGWGNGWAFYAAPNTDEQVGGSEHYFGIMDKTDAYTIERYAISDSAPRPATNTADGSADWKHVDVVFEEGKTSVYINSVLKSSVDSTYSLTDILGESGGIVQIGKANWEDGEYYIGLIDNIQIFNYAKTSEDIRGALQRIEVNPTKTTYNVGDSSLSKWGTTVTAYYEKTSEVVTDYEVSGFDTGNPAENQEITISYGGCEAKFNIRVVEPEDPGTPAEYNFEDSIGDATAIVTGLGNYGSDVTYDENGRVGKAIKLGDYGLKLNKDNLGKNYTVSFWTRPDGGAAAGNTPIISLGHGKAGDEKWLAIAGVPGWSMPAGRDINTYLWSNVTGASTSYAVLSYAKTDSEWVMFTLTGDGTECALYQNGQKVDIESGLSAEYMNYAANILDGAGQDIYLGVNYWDAEYAGLIDDVNVYNKTLSEKQVKELFAKEKAEQILSQNDITVTESLDIPEGKKGEIEVALPEGVNKEDVSISYLAEPSEYVEIEDGVVTALKEGSTVVTTTVSIGQVKKSKQTNVTITEKLVEGPVAIADYDVTQIKDGKLTDKSGKGNDATVVGSNVTSNGSYITITGNDSYITLPTSIMKSLTDKEAFTIEATYTKADNYSASWLFNIGSIPKDTGTNYMFFCPEFRDENARMGIKDSVTEVLMDSADGAPKLTDGTEYTVKMTFNHGDVTVNVNGWNGSKSSGFSIMDDVIIPGTAGDILGYIGRSCWTGDTMFNGTIRSFKIYDDAYGTDVETAEDIFKEQGFTVSESLTVKEGRNDKINVNLPKGIYAGYDAEISYKSGSDEIAEVDGNGTVTGISRGEVDITTTVKVGNALPKSKVTKVTVAPKDIVVSPDDPIQRIAPVYQNDFSAGLDGAKALVTGLADYTGQVQYSDDGLDGRALVLGQYGIKLDVPNIGTKYTVSMWVKPKSILPENMSMLFLGYHDPEKWFGLAGNNGSSEAKVWTHNYDSSSAARWTVLDTVNTLAGDWTMVTLSSDGNSVSIYQNGELVSKLDSDAAKNAADALNGQNQDIYIGVTNWDPEFNGMVDSVRVYSDSLTDEEVSSIFEYDVKNNPVIEQMFENRADAVTEDMILGYDNISEKEVRYNLNLPVSVGGLGVVWESSNTNVLTNDGQVFNGDTDTEITLKAIITNGGFKVTKEFNIIVKALDKSGLQTIIDTAGVINKAYLTEGSAAALESAVSNANTALTSAKNQENIRQAQERLRRVLGNLVFNEKYLNPWTDIEGAAPDKEVTVGAGASVKIFTLPESVKELVDVDYISSDSYTVSYTDGTITGVKAGKATVSAVITAKSDGWIMEYTTIVTVTGTNSVSNVYTAKKDGTESVVSDNSIASPYMSINNVSAYAVSDTQPGAVSSAVIKGKKTVKKGESIRLKVKGISGKVKWSVNDKSRAVIKNGKLKAKKAGKVVVTAKVAGVTLKKTIRIKK